MDFRPREDPFLAITSSYWARSLLNFRTLHVSPSAEFCQYGLLTKNPKLGYLSLPRNVNLIYYPDGGCTRRPAGLDGSAGQPRWARPSLTPPTGRDPLGSRLSVVGRERVVRGGYCESRGFDARLANGELMPGSESLLIVQSLELVPFCRRILKPYNTEMQSSEKLTFVHWKCEI